MRHARYRRVLGALSLTFSLLAACGDCSDEGGEPEAVEAPEGAPEPDLPPRETRLPAGAGAAAPGCIAFCQRSIECAEAEGRPVPPEARDCEQSCGPGGMHHAAPPGVWDCADSPCGTAFQSCSMQAMMQHMRRSEVAVFPMTCEGLCNKMAWCAERTGQTLGAAEQDCTAACAPGGAYAAVRPRELRCVEAACGAELVNCRAAGGPANEPPRAPGAP